MNADPKTDPTSLTSEALRRDVGALEKVLEAKLKCQAEILSLEIASVNKLKEEKFAKVYEHFELIERIRLEQKADTKDRVDAALQAQKEAAYKSEQAFTKQIDALRDLMASHAKTSDDKIAALTVRISMRDGSGAGKEQLYGYIMGALGLIVAAAAIFLRK